jgi:hypothetical protein
MRIEMLMVLAVVGWFATPSRAQDVGVEITAQAQQAIAQFNTTWSKNKVALDALKTREVAENKSLQHILDRAGLSKMQACTDQEKTTNERAIIITLRSDEAALETAAQSEDEENKSRSAQYDEAVSSKASYERRISLFDKRVWSSARLQMILFLHTIFLEYAQVQELSIDNTCTARKILSSKSPVPKEIADMLRTETSRREEYEASILSRRDAYDVTLSLIMRMGRQTL